LFHRDRPEDLFQVRRRTCPGVDGRKQRFSRYSAQRLSKDDDKTSDDESSLDSDSEDENRVASKKRRGSLSSTASNSSKRSRRLWLGDENQAEVNHVTVVSPTSILEDPKTLSVSIDADDSSATFKKSDRMEMMEQSLIVSEVASKLEEFVKKARKRRGPTRSRAGIVTPPYRKATMISSRDLITYDDEYEQQEKYSSAGLVTDGEESVDSIDLSSPGTYEYCKTLSAAPVENREKVQAVVFEIRQRAKLDVYNCKSLDACADVVEFLMTTAPSEACCEKVLRLLIASARLASDFHSYRSALNFDGKALWTPAAGESCEDFHTSTLRRAFKSGSSQVDTLREFKIFAVNLIYKLLGKDGSFEIKKPFSLSDTKNLLRTADAWSKSVHVGQIA
jgi:hypothetical protein